MVDAIEHRDRPAVAHDAPRSTAPGANPRRERNVSVRSRGFGGFWRASPFLAPALALYVLPLVVPVVRAVQLSFAEWSGFDEPQWVGLENYIRLFH